MVRTLHPDQLKKELERRKQRDPKYSLRRFAKDLDVSKSALSAYLSGQRGLLPSTARRIGERLGLQPEAIRSISTTINRKRKWDRASSYTEITHELLGVLEDEACLAILSLARMENRADPEWVARRLKLSVARAARAIRSLERLDLIKVEDGRLFRSTPLLNYPSQQSSTTIQNYHRALTGRALGSLDSVDVKDRHFGAVTMPVNPEHLPEARKMLDRFKRRLSNFLNRGATSEVYALTLQLFPLSDPKVKPA